MPCGWPACWARRAGAALLITAIGPANVVAFDAVSFLACAALLTLVPVTAGLTERNDLGYLRQLGDGFAFVPQASAAAVDLGHGVV